MNKFDVKDLDSGTDYRKMPRALSNVYFTGLNEENNMEINKVFSALTDHDGPVVQNRELDIWGRKLKIPESSDNIAKFTFAELCSKPLSAADYLEVTKRFGTVFVLDVPRMGLEQKDYARRFITFIDACYESHVSHILYALRSICVDTSVLFRPSSSPHQKCLYSRYSRMIVAKTIPKR
jgi:peroxisome-assembly ATPase